MPKTTDTQKAIAEIDRRIAALQESKDILLSVQKQQPKRTSKPKIVLKESQA